MTTLVPVAVSPLRQRLIDEMDIRRFSHELPPSGERSE
jgi:hypothetical protein